MTMMWVMFGLAGLFGLVAGAITLFIVAAAFRSSAKEGLLSLLLPGYVVYFALVRFKHPRKTALLAACAIGAVGAGLCATFSTAFAPQPTVNADEAFNDLEGFDDLGSFDDLDGDKP